MSSAPSSPTSTVSAPHPSHAPRPRASELTGLWHRSPPAPDRATLAPSHVGQWNVADTFTRRLVHPMVNLAHHFVNPHPIYNAADSYRRDTAVLACQKALAVIALVGALKNFADTPVSPLHSRPGQHVGLGFEWLGLAALGGTIGGSYIGAHLAAPFLKTKEHFDGMLERHSETADVGGYLAAGLAGAGTVTLAMAMLVGPSYWLATHDNVEIPFWLRDCEAFGFALANSAVGIACMGWYLGRLGAAGAAEAIEQLLPHRSVALAGEDA